MPEVEPTKQRFSLIRDILRSVAILTFWLAVLFSVFAIATLVCIIYGPGWGLLVSILGFPVWKYLGARPCPGFADGCMCILGYTWMLGIVLAQLIRCVKFLLY
jgi:hypothetical protein